MEKWYQKPPCIILALILIPPLGIILMYKHSKFAIIPKAIITIADVIWLMFWATMMFFGFPLIDILFILIYILSAFLLNQRSAQLKNKSVQNNDRPYFDVKNQNFHIPARYDGYELAYHYENINIAGASHYNLSVDESLLGKEISFLPEPENEHDSNAIKIMCNGAMIGYVHKGKIQGMILDWQKRSDPVFSVISQIDIENRDIRYFIAFYKSIDVSEIINICKEDSQSSDDDEDSENEFED